MGNQNILIIYFSVLAETTYLYLVYSCLSLLSKVVSGDLISFSAVLVITLVVTSINIIISRNTSLLSSLILNTIVTIILTSATLFVYAYPSFNNFWKFNLFKNDLWLIIQVCLLILLNGFIVFRSMIISGRKISFRKANIRCEITISIFLLVAIFAGITQTQIPHIMEVIIAGLLFNFIAIALSQEARMISFRYWGIGILGLGLLMGSLAKWLTNGQVFLAGISQMIYENTMPYISSTFLAAMKFLLTKGKYIESTPQPSTINTKKAINNQWLMSQDSTPIWLKYMLGILLAIILLAISVILIFLLINLIKFLLRKRNSNPLGEQEDNLNFWVFFHGKIQGIILQAKVFYSIFLLQEINLEKIYSYLLLWGKQRKILYYPNETPYEYSLKLIKKYPEKYYPIELITQSYVAYRYGNIIPNVENMEKINKSLKRLFFPLT